MPIYDYCCKEHGVFEEYHPHIDDTPESCPECKALCHRVRATEQRLNYCGYVKPPKAQKKFGERHRVPHRPVRWV